MLKKMQANVQGLLTIAVLIVLNLIASAFFLRIDLTKEKRYSLSEVSIQTVDSLQYPMYVTVFLEGDFPPNIREFQDALETNLQELSQYSHGNLNFEFVDPSNNRELLKDFQSKGFDPVPVKVRVNATETKMQLMWPLAVFRYREREQYVDLLRGATLPDNSVDFPQAESDLEYKVVSTMRNLTRERRGIVGLLRGHGEWNNEEVNELGAELANSYNLVDYNQRGKYAGEAISPEISVMLILQPKGAFSERDKYELDQYLMRGGRLLFVLSPEVVDMDMFQKRSTLTDLRDWNLDDLFLKYGFKVNYDLVQDFVNESTDVFIESGSGGTFASQKWPFYPLVRSFPRLPMTRNVEGVLLRYPSSIDTLHRPFISHSVFLTTSPRSRKLDGRQFIDLNEVMQSPPPQSLYNKGPQIVGDVAEGLFTSLFTGRQAPVDSFAPQPPTVMFGQQNNPLAPGAVAIISDGNFVRPRFFRGDYTYMPYDNKALVLNLVDYLAGDEALTRIRSKEVVVRSLDQEKIHDHSSLLRYLNLLLPVVLVVAFGFIRAWWRKRKNERKKIS